MPSKDCQKEEKDRFIFNKNNIRPRVAVNKIHWIKLKTSVTRTIIVTVEEFMHIRHLNPSQATNKAKITVYFFITKNEQTYNPIILHLLLQHNLKHRIPINP